MHVLKGKAIWAAAFADAEQLRELGVGDPKGFIEHREDCVLLFADQVPFFCLAKSSKQYYGKNEYRAKADKPTAEQKMGTKSGGHNASEVVANADEVWAGQQGEGGEDDGQTQSRGAEHKGADKFRITVELVHAVYNYFKKGAPMPVGRLEKALVVLSGEYAYEGNIDNTHCFIETKHFMVAGVPKVHEAGTFTMLMYNLIEFRKKHADKFEEFREYMIIMQQPSGFVDKIIMKWHLEIQGRRYPCSVGQRDLFTGAYCEESRPSMAAINQMSTWVWGKMSACLQLTDTDAANPF